MQRIFLFGLLFLAGCVNVYGPAKQGRQQDVTTTQNGSNTGQTTTVIGNRQPEELIVKIENYFAAKGIKTLVNNRELGIIGASGNITQFADLYLDCSLLKQTSNIDKNYRIVVQAYSAGEGANVLIQVTGIAGLIATDGNDKVKPEECKSSGVFEKDLFEVLRK